MATTADGDDDYVSTKASLPKFNGAHKDFQVYWTRFMAFAAVYRFTQALGDTAEADLPTSDSEVLDPNDAGDKKKIAARARNNKAMANLTMSFQSEQLMGLIYKAINTDWPGALAYLVVKALKSKYMPVDMVTMIDLRRAMAAVKMNKGEDPTTIFEQIAGIENRFRNAQIKPSEQEKLAVAMMAAPAEYIPVITSEQRVKGASLQLEDLQEVMIAQYRQSYPDRADAGSEIALNAADGFTGLCYNCNQRGHRANKCPQRANGGSGRGNGGRGRQGGGRGRGRDNRHRNLNCRLCGKRGHI